MKKSKRCPKCHHPEILHVPEPRNSDHDYPALGVREGFLKDVIGVMEAYACLGCGFVEWHVQDVATLDVKKLKGASVLRATPEPPYR